MENEIVINGVTYVAKATTGKEVIVRTYTAGVHIGEIKEKNGSEITLINARRLRNWSNAFTLNTVATNGVKRDNRRISKPVPEITLQWIEIIPVIRRCRPYNYGEITWRVKPFYMDMDMDNIP